MNNITLHAELIATIHSDFTQLHHVETTLKIACLNKRLRAVVANIFEMFAIKTLNENVEKLTLEQIETFRERITYLSQDKNPKKFLITYLMIHATGAKNALFVPIPEAITDKNIALELAKKLPIHRFIESAKTFSMNLLQSTLNELNETTLIHAYYFCTYEKYQRPPFAPPSIVDTLTHLISVLFKTRGDLPHLQKSLTENNFLYLNEAMYHDPQLWKIALQSHIFFTPKYSSDNRPVLSLLQKALLNQDHEKTYAIIRHFFEHPELINTNTWALEDRFGYFPIIHAVLMNDPVLVGLLCTLGASLDQEIQRGEQYGWTPLHFAMFNDSPIAQDLIEMGCDPLKENTKGIKPIHLLLEHLIESGNTEKLLMIFEQYDWKELLTEKILGGLCQPQFLTIFDAITFD